jgi:DNA repair exonuclease SbcCD nuclease subunit
MIFLAADCHLGKALRAHSPILGRDGIDALTDLEIVLKREAAAAVSAPVLILAGDVFDANKIDGACIDTLTRFCAELKAAGFRIMFVQGNHDIQNGRGDCLVPLLVPMGCEHIHNKVVEIDGLKIYGLDYSPAEAYHTAMEAVPPCDLLVTHVAYQHLLGFEGAYTMRLDQVPAHVGNVLVGDIHVKDVTKLPNSAGYIVSPGSLHPTKIDEQYEHGVFMIQTAADFKAPKFLPVANRAILQFELAEMTDAEIYTAWDKFTPTNDKAPCVRLVYYSTEAELERLHVLEDYFTKAGAVLFTKMAGRETLDGEVRQTITRDVFSMVDALPYALDSKANTEAYALLEQLLSTNTPQVLLEEYCAMQLAN